MKTLQQTVVYQGRRYAIECGCKERGGWMDYSSRKAQAMGRMELELEVIGIPCCNWCGYYPWIILPVEEKN